MPKGGWRGGGRPEGSQDAMPRRRRTRAEIAATAAGLSAERNIASSGHEPSPDLGGNEDPISYLYRVMNDTRVEASRRDRAALALASIELRAGLRPLGRKQQAQLDAETAGVGTDWGDDLLWRPSKQHN